MLLTSANFVYKQSIGTIYGYITSKGLQKLLLFNEGLSKPYVLHETPNILLGRLLTMLFDRYFSGIPEQFKQVPLDISGGTEFQQKVWTALRKVPWGKTYTYTELANLAGLSPKYARAVGQALHRNPIPIIIPCHRVLNANRSLGGFSSGLEWKKKLLQIEHSLERE
ncbi:MAG: methylated-DNA--[protein]-cysteine S-methyltransferase [Candidatus Hydrogenedens sp.]